MRDLMLLRHAEAGSASGHPDHDRPLTAEGRRQAAGVAERIHALGTLPLLGLSSTAVRAQQTLEEVAAALDGLEQSLEGDLYLAAGEVVLQRIQRLPDDRPSVLVVGHTPGLQDLALTLTAEQIEERLMGCFPAGALVALRFEVTSWAGVRPGEGRLLGFSVP